MTIKLHHIGIGVKNLEEVVGFFQVALKLKPERYVDLSGSRAALIPVGDTILELIEPSDGPQNQAAESLYRLVKEKGGGVHHFAFEVEDIQVELAELEKKGLSLTQEGLIEGKGGKFAWLQENAANGFMVELCDRGYQIK